jgi:hypothetical protein
MQMFVGDHDGRLPARQRKSLNVKGLHNMGF